MKRREFITLLGGAAGWPLSAHAQQGGTVRHIGVLLVGLRPEGREAKQLRLGLRDLGYSEGRDVVIEWRSANGDYDRLPNLVADLVQRRVDLIVQDSTVGTEVTKRATSTIPIVMALVLDPVGSGLVRSLASPGGNITGLSMMATELIPSGCNCLRRESTTNQSGGLVESRSPFPCQSGREPQKNSAFAFDRAEFCRCTKPGAIRTSHLECHSGEGSGAIHR